jgi:hypothetical protein
MKRIFLLLATGILPIIASYAQDNKMKVDATKYEIPQKFDLVSNASNSNNKIVIHPKAVKDLNRTFEATTDVVWCVIKSGFMAEFKKADIQYRVIYSNKGKRVATYRYYKEGLLNSDVRKLIKSTWYDAAITNVTEVNYAGTIAYIVNIEDKTSIKLIKFVNNEMEVYQEIIKI